MTHIAVKARIRWVPAEQGGRRLPPPSGSRYSTVARFEDETTTWTDEAWSIIADITEPPNESLETMATIEFLAADAPTELLRAGNQFVLFEGARIVARGQVLG